MKQPRQLISERAERCRVICRDCNRSSPATVSLSGELCAEKTAKINRFKRHYVVCRIATRARRRKLECGLRQMASYVPRSRKQ